MGSETGKGDLTDGMEEENVVEEEVEDMDEDHSKNKDFLEEKMEREYNAHASPFMNPFHVKIGASSESSFLPKSLSNNVDSKIPTWYPTGFVRTGPVTLPTSR